MRKREALLSAQPPAPALRLFMDDYAKERPFSDSDRPLELKNLHFVALVQNDDTSAVLLAGQVEVTGEPAAQERPTSSSLIPGPGIIQLGKSANMKKKVTDAAADRASTGVGPV